MKKIYNILCGILIFAMLTVGVISLFDKDLTFSDVENRALRGFPKIRISSILDGSFIEDLEAYYADTFPGREGLAETFQGLEWFYAFGGTPDEIN